jgi:serine/threonine protein phosphatase PrpC
MTVDVAGCTHIGLKRKENQDGFLAEHLTDSFVCLAVADGMGGHQEGKRASMEAIKTLRQRLADLGDGGVTKELAVGIEEAAHASVGKIASGNDVVGTTLTVALIKDRECVIGHVGDSRVYRLHDGYLEQVTVDHTWEAHFRNKPGENPYGNALRQAVGVGDQVETESHCLRLDQGDVLVVCSDGLYKMVPDAGIARALKSTTSAKAACNQLLKLALKAGGRDNVAICVGRVGVTTRQSWIDKLMFWRKG